MSKRCPQCHGDVGKRLTVVETIGGYTFGCPHRVHALAQDVVDAAVDFGVARLGKIPRLGKVEENLRSAVARLREETEKA